MYILIYICIYLKVNCQRVEIENFYLCLDVLRASLCVLISFVTAYVNVACFFLLHLCKVHENLPYSFYV